MKKLIKAAGTMGLVGCAVMNSSFAATDNTFWYIGGNILFGGILGWLIIDPATGAMWKLDTNEINVTLDTPKKESMIEPNKARIVLLDDVPLSLRDKMVKVSP